MSIIVHASGPPEGAEYGAPPVLVAREADCPDCGGVHDMEACPDCGADIRLGFGLAGGPGFGPWKLCEAACGWSWKRALPHDEC